MSEWIEITAKSVEDAAIEAGVKLGVPIESIVYEVIEKESSGFLGLNKKPAKIRARIKEETEFETEQEPEKTTIKELKEPKQPKDTKELEEPKGTKEIKELKAPKEPKAPIDPKTLMEQEKSAETFLGEVFEAMGVSTQMNFSFDEEERMMNINLIGDDMGILIGKRGQTLDSLQYLVSLVINKDRENYIKVKLDTENYRERRKETLENLAKNIATKVRRTGHPVALEPMNPYERRIIHSVLQNNKYVETHSEGEEPYRKVIVALKKGVRDYGGGYYNNRSGYGKGRGYHRGGYNKGGYRKYDKKESMEDNEE